MTYSAKHYRVNPNSPQAKGVCDRCKFPYRLDDLNYQMEYRGAALVNTRRRVCESCMDVPNTQLAARRIPPDPLPVVDPRPENSDTLAAATHALVQIGPTIIDILG